MRLTVGRSVSRREVSVGLDLGSVMSEAEGCWALY